MKIYNPATGELIRDLNESTDDDIKATYTRLREGQQAWRLKSLAERISCIDAFNQLLEQECETLAEALSLEMGKPLQESRGEINGARYRIDYFLENSERVLAETIQNEVNGVKELLRFEPLGVICNISAWNYPYLIGVNVFIPALIAGNAVLYKPSEYATTTGQHIARLLYQSGVPEDVFQLAIGDGTVGDKLLDLDCDGYYITRIKLRQH